MRIRLFRALWLAALLLMFTFVLGTGAILVTPAYQSLVPDMVPRALVPDAAALNSISINLARAIGPAIAGLLVAQVGVAAVFALNTATVLAYAIVVACHPKLGSTPQSPERFLPGLRAGTGYARNAPVVRRILLRAALFLVPGSSLWALLPLIATGRLGLGSSGYGVLLGALGAGAVGGAFLLPQIRARLSPNTMAAAASLTYAAALAVVVLSRNLALTIVMLLPAGAAWIAFLSNVNAALQLFLPGWVRARGLAVYQMVLFGAQAAGRPSGVRLPGPPGWCPPSWSPPPPWPPVLRRSGSGRSATLRAWIAARCAGRSRTCLSAPTAASRSWCGPPAPSPPTESSSSCRQ